MSTVEAKVRELYFRLHDGQWDRYVAATEVPVTGRSPALVCALAALVTATLPPLFASRMRAVITLPRFLHAFSVISPKVAGLPLATGFGVAASLKWKAYQKSETAMATIRELEDKSHTNLQNDPVNLRWAQKIIHAEQSRFFADLPEKIKGEFDHYWSDKDAESFNVLVQKTMQELRNQDQSLTALFRNNPELMDEWRDNYSRLDQREYLAQLPHDRLVWTTVSKKGSEMSAEEKRRQFFANYRTSDAYKTFAQNFSLPFEREEFVQVACGYYASTLRQASTAIHGNDDAFFQGVRGEADPVVKLPTTPESEVIVFGDTHEDLVSLDALLTKLKAEDRIGDDLVLTEKGKQTFIVQLGDRVDDGPFGPSSEIIWMALAWKNPENVVLMRGNHEHFATGLSRSTNLRAGWPEKSPLPEKGPFQQLMWMEPVMVLFGGQPTWQIISHAMPAEGVQLESFLNDTEARNTYITAYDRPHFAATLQEQEPRLKVNLPNPQLLHPIPDHQQDTTYFGADFNWLLPEPRTGMEGNDVEYNEGFGHGNLAFSLAGVAATVKYLGGKHRIDTLLSGHDHQPCINEGGVQHLSADGLDIWRAYSAAYDSAIRGPHQGAGYMELTYKEGLPKVAKHSLNRTAYATFFDCLQQGTLFTH